MIPDYYQILGIKDFATPAVIKRAYLDLAKKYHPDHFNHGKTEQEIHTNDILFGHIKQAYECLSNPTTKRDYDWERKKNMPRQHTRTANTMPTFNKTDAQPSPPQPPKKQLSDLFNEISRSYFELSWINPDIVNFKERLVAVFSKEVTQLDAECQYAKQLFATSPASLYADIEANYHKIMQKISPYLAWIAMHNDVPAILYPFLDKISCIKSCSDNNARFTIITLVKGTI